MKKNEQSLRDLRDFIKHTNLHMMRVPEDRKEQKEQKPKASKLWLTEGKLHIPESQQTPGRISSRRATLKTL